MNSEAGPSNTGLSRRDFFLQRSQMKAVEDKVLSGVLYGSLLGDLHFALDEQTARQQKAVSFGVNNLP